MSNTSSLTGKVIAITGASSGIGEATARLLAQRGASLVLGARRTERLEKLVTEIRTQGGTAEFMTLDVTKQRDVEEFINYTVKRYGQIDALVNNAGIMPLSPMSALKVDEWNRMIDVNIRGVLHGIAAGLPIMKRQGFGQFVNVSSIAGHAVWPTTGVYSATKYAVLAISDALRQENSDIRVTVVSPGATESELAETITDDSANKLMVDFRRIALSATAIARAIAFAVEQPTDVDVNEIIVRATATPY